MKQILTGAVLVLSLAVSCKNPDKTETNEAKAVNFGDPSCYQFTGDRDTVTLKFSKGNDSVTGTLVYNIFQKDKNTGTINGHLNGDLLIADYVFMSEGANSTRQVAFKKVGDDWVEGYGDTKEENGKVVFTNTDSLEFEPKLALKKTDCGKVN